MSSFLVKLELGLARLIFAHSLSVHNSLCKAWLLRSSHALLVALAAHRELAAMVTGCKVSVLVGLRALLASSYLSLV